MIFNIRTNAIPWKDAGHQIGIKEMQTKTTVRFTWHLLDWPSSNSEIMVSVGKDVKKPDPKYAADGSKKTAATSENSLADPCHD